MPSIALTDRFVSGVKPAAGKRTDYPDKLAKGLTLRVFPSGVKSWTYRYLSPRDGAGPGFIRHLPIDRLGRGPRPRHGGA